MSPSKEDSKREPPVRDVCAINNVAYGSGHEKYPSWPMAAVAELPLATKAPPTGGSKRSKSWTDHTDYHKEVLVPFTRPYMKRSHSSQNQQHLKTVHERCEKTVNIGSYRYPPKHVINQEIPEKDTSFSNMQKFKTSSKNSNGVLCDDISKKSTLPLTQAELEEYTRNFDEINIQHQKQPSYAQSEGYHSYVSSTDSTSTPFLDRLRRDIESTNARNIHSWDHDSVVTTSSGSVSSSETLKWHGSFSDVSIASSSINPGKQQLIAHSARVKTPQRHNSESILFMGNGENTTALEKRPQKLFPIATYTLQRTPSDQKHSQQRARSLYFSPPSPQKTVAERVHQFEKQTTKYSYLDPDKKTKLSDPALKAIQKQALLMFYERHQGQIKAEAKSKANSNLPENKANLTLALPHSDETHKNEQRSYQRSSSKNEEKQWSPPTYKVDEQLFSYQNSSINEMVPRNKNEFYNPTSYNEMSECLKPTHIKQTSMYELCDSSEPSLLYPDRLEPVLGDDVHLNSSNNTHESLQGPIILGPSISLDDWVPERPPKNPQLLRSAFPDLYTQSSPPRSQSPDLPLPSPPLPSYEDDTINMNDEPFPPPPLEIVNDWMPQPTQIPTQIPTNSKPPSRSHACIDPSKLKIENLNLQCVRKNPISPLRPVPLKREYPSTKLKNNKEAVRRNSFANSSDVSRDMLRNTTLRSSVMDRGHSQACPQKPVGCSHRNLQRSITTDESNNIKPINPFLWSTSMKTYNVKLERRISGDFSHVDKKIIYPNQSKQLTNRLNNEKLNKNIENAKLELENTLSTSEKPADSSDGKQNGDDRDITKRSSLHSIVPEKEKCVKSVINPNINNNQSHLNTHEMSSDVRDDPGLRRAVPFKQYIQKELPSPGKMIADSCSIKREMPLMTKKLAVDYKKPNKKEKLESNETEVNKKETTDSEIKPNERTNTSNGSFNSKSLPVNSRTNEENVLMTVYSLKSRKKLPTEIEWYKLCSQLISVLPKDNHLIGLISQYEAYNNTIKAVSETFEIKVSVSCESLKDFYLEKNTRVSPECDECGLKKMTTNEDPVELMMKAHKCLLKLKHQLSEELVNLEKSLEDNEKLKTDLINILPKNNKVLRYTEDIGGVASLIMMIKSRLALYSSPPPSLNKTGDYGMTIESKQAKLLEKLQDAEELKESIYKKSSNLVEILFKENNADLMEKYHFYVGEKIRLVVYNKDLKYNQDLVNQLIKFFEDNKYA